MDLFALFTPQARDEVAAAVRQVERESAAEVVPVVVESSGDYPQAPWRAATLGALGFPALLTLLLSWVEVWGLPWELWLLSPTIAGAALGFLLAKFVPSLARLVITQEEMEKQVQDRAEHAFLTEEVFATSQRTGMLVFVSLFERRVVILGDRGIAAKIPHKRWQAIAQGIAQGIREGRPAEALIWGIQKCGELLLEAGVVVKPGDKNELPDTLRLSGEEQ